MTKKEVKAAYREIDEEKGNLIYSFDGSDIVFLNGKWQNTSHHLQKHDNLQSI